MKEINKIATKTTTNYYNNNSNVSCKYAHARTHSNIYTKKDLASGMQQRKQWMHYLSAPFCKKIIVFCHQCYYLRFYWCSMLSVLPFSLSHSFILCFHSGCWSCCCIITMFHYNLSTQRLRENFGVNIVKYGIVTPNGDRSGWRENGVSEDSTLKWIHWKGNTLALALNVHIYVMRGCLTEIRRFQRNMSKFNCSLINIEKKKAHSYTKQKQKKTYTHTNTQARMFANP